MTKADAITRFKTLRQALDKLLQELKDVRKQVIEALKDPQIDKEFENGGEAIAQLTLSQRAAEDSIMRLGMALKYTGAPTPYPESKLTAGTLAKQCYDAYCESTGWKSAVTGQPLPAWESLCEQAETGDERMKGVKAGWLAVAITHPALLHVAPTADNMKM